MCVARRRIKCYNTFWLIIKVVVARHYKMIERSFRMITNKENLFKLGKKLTDRIPQKLGLEPLTEADPEYWGL